MLKTSASLFGVMLLDKTVSFRAAHDKARMQKPAILHERAKTLASRRLIRRKRSSFFLWFQRRACEHFRRRAFRAEYLTCQGTEKDRTG
jgi:hypothetical protein